jgi:hypothetical protein
MGWWGAYLIKKNPSKKVVGPQKRSILVQYSDASVFWPSEFIQLSRKSVNKSPLA